MNNYARKSKVKNVTGVDTSDFAKKADLASLKSEVNELDVDRLETISNDLSNLSNIIDKDVAKRLYVLCYWSW